MCVGEICGVYVWECSEFFFFVWRGLRHRCGLRLVVFAVRSKGTLWVCSADTKVEVENIYGSVIRLDTHNLSVMAQSSAAAPVAARFSDLKYSNVGQNIATLGPECRHIAGQKKFVYTDFRKEKCPISHCCFDYLSNRICTRSTHKPIEGEKESAHLFISHPNPPNRTTLQMHVIQLLCFIVSETDWPPVNVLLMYFIYFITPTHMTLALIHIHTFPKQRNPVKCVSGALVFGPLLDNRLQRLGEITTFEMCVCFK